MAVIYCIRQLSTNIMIYIGSGKYLSSRRCTHKFMYEKFPDRKLYKFMRENGGWDAFTFEVLEETDVNSLQLRYLEKDYIKRNNPICNLYTPISSREEYLRKKLDYKKTKEGCISKPWMKQG